MIACATTGNVVVYKVSSSASNCSFVYRAVFTYSVMICQSTWLDLIEVFRRVVHEVRGPLPRLATGSPDPAEPETQRKRLAAARQ